MTGLIKSRQREYSSKMIIEAALYEFALHGYRGANIEDIAKRSGFTKGLITLRFGTKEELFIQVLNKEMSEYVTELEKFDLVKSKKEIIDFLMNFYIDYYKKLCLENQISFLFAKTYRYIEHEASPKVVNFISGKMSNGIGGKINYAICGSNKALTEEFIEVKNTFKKCVINVTAAYYDGKLEFPSNERYIELFGPIFEKFI